MTIDLQTANNGGSMPGVYDPPPGASLGLASVLASPQVTSGSAVRLKASDTMGRQGRRTSVGLNFLSTSPNSEKKAELNIEAPTGVHKVSGQIFSRHTSPMGSVSSGIKILDPETKARLMEKVKKIRAEKAAKQPSPQHPLMTTNALMVAPSLAVSNPRSTASLGGMLMSSSTSSTPRMSVLSCETLTTGSRQQGSAISASTFALPKMAPSVGPTMTPGSALTVNTPSYSRNILSTGISSTSMAGSKGSGLLSPSSSPFPPVLGQSRMISSPMASPMSILASSRPITATTATCRTTMAGLGEALDPTGLGQLLDLDSSVKARTVISKTKTVSSAKRL